MGWITEEEKAVAVAGIVAEEGEEVPGPTPPPVTPLPPGETGIKPAEVREAVSGTFLERHAAIKKLVDKRGYDYLCTTVDRLADELGLAPEVVQEHLDVLELDEAGRFLQTKTELDRAFCSVDSLQRLVENLRKLKV